MFGWLFGISEFLINHRILFGDYNFKKRHLIYRRHQGGGGGRGQERPGGTAETRGSVKIQLETSVWYITPHFLYKLQPWNMPTSGKFLLSKLWQINKRRRRWWRGEQEGWVSMAVPNFGCASPLRVLPPSPAWGSREWSSKVKFILLCYMNKPWDLGPQSR